MVGQVKWYVYSDQTISKRGFEDRYFREMMKTQGSETILTTATLEKWLDGEWDLMEGCLGWLHSESFKLNKGNPGGV